jgi:hypothetical protein
MCRAAGQTIVSVHLGLWAAKVRTGTPAGPFARATAAKVPDEGRRRLTSRQAVTCAPFMSAIPGYRRPRATVTSDAKPAPRRWLDETSRAFGLESEEPGSLRAWGFAR